MSARALDVGAVFVALAVFIALVRGGAAMLGRLRCYRAVRALGLAGDDRA